MEAEVDVSDEEDEDADIIPLPLVGGDLSSAKTASLDKMVGLVAVLVEKSRGEDNLIHLAQVHSTASDEDPIFCPPHIWIRQPPPPQKRPEYSHRPSIRLNVFFSGENCCCIQIRPPRI